MVKELLAYRLTDEQADAILRMESGDREKLLKELDCGCDGSREEDYPDPVIRQLVHDRSVETYLNEEYYAGLN